MNFMDIRGDIARYRGDLYLMFSLLTVAAFGSFFLSGQLNKVLVSSFGLDFWFHSDTARVFWNMSDPASDHGRATVHPLFSLFTTPVVLSLCTILDTDRLSAVRMVIASVAGVWAAMMYVLLRLIGLFRIDALLFSCLAVFSSSAVFWLSVPETFSFGSVSILFALILLALSTRGRPAGEGFFVLAGIATLGFTVTNWMVGLAASFLSLPWKKAVRCNVIALLSVAFFSYFQRYFLTYVPFFIGSFDKGFASSSDEVDFLFMKETGGPVRILISFFYHSIIMPGIRYADKMNRQNWEILSVQFSQPLSGNIAGIIAGVLWLILLAVGIWAMYTVKKDRKIRLGIFLALSGQLALHLIYGDETFLYSMHYVPLLIIIAAYGTLTGLRKFVLGAVFIVCIGAAVNNLMQFFWAADMLTIHFFPKVP